MTDSTEPLDNWYIYLIRTRVNSLYCGITTDLERRFAQHSAGQGAKALRGRGPLELVWHSEDGMCHSKALKLEYRIKRISKARKEALVSDELHLKDLTE